MLIHFVRLARIVIVLCLLKNIIHLYQNYQQTLNGCTSCGFDHALLDKLQKNWKLKLKPQDVQSFLENPSDVVSNLLGAIQALRVDSDDDRHPGSQPPLF